ncbi:LytTR family DNA-binding domain-containing protein [Hymenobacter aranciens]|nr:LytTR family DNA-binding domain-containing protein [Hymenobacter sp. ASUV-10]
MNTPQAPSENDDSQPSLALIYVELLGLRVVGPTLTASEAIEVCAGKAPALAILDGRLTDEEAAPLLEQLVCISKVPVIIDYTGEYFAALGRICSTETLTLLPNPYTAGALSQLIEASFSHAAYLVEGPVELGPRPKQGLDASCLFVREQNLVVRINIDDIVCVEKKTRYCLLQLATGQHYSLRVPLTQLRQRLEPLGFVQVHRSWLLPLHHIQIVDLTANIIYLNAGLEIPLGRAYRDRVIERLQTLN